MFHRTYLFKLESHEKIALFRFKDGHADMIPPRSDVVQIRVSPAAAMGQEVGFVSMVDLSRLKRGNF